jgi:hypothetical protein
MARPLLHRSCLLLHRSCLLLLALAATSACAVDDDPELGQADDRSCTSIATSATEVLGTAIWSATSTEVIQHPSDDNIASLVEVASLGIEAGAAGACTRLQGVADPLDDAAAAVRAKRSTLDDLVASIRGVRDIVVDKLWDKFLDEDALAYLGLVRDRLDAEIDEVDADLATAIETDPDHIVTMGLLRFRLRDEADLLTRLIVPGIEPGANQNLASTVASELTGIADASAGRDTWPSTKGMLEDVVDQIGSAAAPI